MPAIRDIKKAIEEADWDELTPRLIAYTRLRLKGLPWRGNPAGVIPGGWEVEDFIQSAIGKALTGMRKWDGEQDLLEFLKGIISSEVSSRFGRLENRRERRATTVFVEKDAYTIDISTVVDDSLVASPRFFEDSESREKVLALMQDPIDREILRLVIDEGMDRPREIAGKLNITVQDFWNRKKRLRRRRNELLRAGTGFANVMEWIDPSTRPDEVQNVEEPRPLVERG